MISCGIPVSRADVDDLAGELGAQPVVHSAASGPPFHGLRTSGAIVATPRPRPKMPAAAPAERMISERRAMPVSLPAAASCAMTVLRATSVRGAVVALLDGDLVREELLHVRDHPDAQREHGEPEETADQRRVEGVDRSSRACRAPRTRRARTGRQTRNASADSAEMMNHSRDRVLGALLGAGARDRPLARVVDDLDVVELGGEPRQLRLGHVLELGGRRLVAECAALMRGGHDLAPSHSANPISRGEPDDEGDDAFGHRADAAERVAAGVVVVAAHRLDVGDDVLLLLRRELPVGELRHVLRAGEHRRVDLALRRRVERSGRTCPRTARRRGR